MVRNTEHILGSYLISRSILFFSLSMVLFAQDSTKLVVEKDSTFYPGKPLLLSLVLNQTPSYRQLVRLNL